MFSCFYFNFCLLSLLIFLMPLSTFADAIAHPTWPKPQLSSPRDLLVNKARADWMMEQKSDNRGTYGRGSVQRYFHACSTGLTLAGREFSLIPPNRASSTICCSNALHRHFSRCRTMNVITLKIYCQVCDWLNIHQQCTFHYILHTILTPGNSYSHSDSNMQTHTQAPGLTFCR